VAQTRWRVRSLSSAAACSNRDVARCRSPGSANCPGWCGPATTTSPILADENLRLTRVIDETHLAYPFFGSRQMDHDVNRERVRQLVQQLRLEAIYRKPNLSGSNQPRNSEAQMRSISAKDTRNEGRFAETTQKTAPNRGYSSAELPCQKHCRIAGNRSFSQLFPRIRGILHAFWAKSPFSTNSRFEAQNP